MNSVPSIALGLALALGGVSIGAPAFAQQPAEISLGEQEREALQALKTALDARNYPAATAALATAQAAARSGYSRYLASALQLRLGVETGSYGLQTTAIDSMITSGAVPAADMPQLYKSQGALAMSAGEYKDAEASFTRWVEAAPNDPEALLALAEAKNLRKKTPEAVALIGRAIDLRTAANQPVPESWYTRGLKHAFDARAVPQSIALSRGLVAAYPTAENWRDALLIRRDLGQLDPAATIDLLRLLRSAGALAGERDYETVAQALLDAGLPGEAKAVLDEGVAKKMIDPAKGSFKALIATASKKAAAERGALKGLETKAMAAATGAAALSAGDAFLSYGDHAKAAELYRAAIQKGSVDANVANTRLGMALGMAGQKVEAEAALRAVTGARADLASLWLLWLAQRG